MRRSFVGVGGGSTPRADRVLTACGRLRQPLGGGRSRLHKRCPASEEPSRTQLTQLHLEFIFKFLLSTENTEKCTYKYTTGRTGKKAETEKKKVHKDNFWSQDCAFLTQSQVLVLLL